MRTPESVGCFEPLSGPNEDVGSRLLREGVGNITFNNLEEASRRLGVVLGGINYPFGMSIAPWYYY
jgi:hypothetical protein